MTELEYRMIPGTRGGEIRAYLACPRAWHGQYVTGQYVPAVGEELLVGQYFHALVLEPARAAEVLAETGGVAKSGPNKGHPKEPWRQAEEMAGAVLASSFWRAASAAGVVAEQPMTGTIGGHAVKVRLDCLLKSRYCGMLMVVDLKSVGVGRNGKAFADEWVEVPGTRGERAPWYDAREYTLSAYLQAEIARQNLGQAPLVAMLCASKQVAPAVKKVIYRPDGPTLPLTIATLTRALDAMATWRAAGTVPDASCGECEWCRRTTDYEPIWRE